MLGKVHDKHKYKSFHKSEKVNEFQVEEPKLEHAMVKTTSQGNEGVPTTTTEVSNFNLLDEIKSDIQAFNQIINPKALREIREEPAGDKDSSRPLKKSKVSSQKDLLSLDRSYVKQDHPILTETPTPGDFEKKTQRISDNVVKKIELTPE